MSALPNIIGLLILAQRSLSRKGNYGAAEALERPLSDLREANARNLSFVARIESTAHEVVADVIETEDLSAASLAVRTAASKKTTPAQWKQLRRKLKMHPPRQKRWLCCSAPEKRRLRQGGNEWGAVCRYRIQSGKTRGTLRGAWIHLGTGGQRPTIVKIGGRRMKVCADAAVR